MQYTFKTRIIIISALALMWFSFPVMIYLRGTIDKNDLKVVSGALKDWQIITIPGHKHPIDVLSFSLINHEDKIALYLNNRKDYKPITDKLSKNQPIKISYNDKGGVGADGYNLHIYQIDSGNENIISYENTTSKDKKVATILLLVGIVFFAPIFFMLTRRQKIIERGSK